MAKTKVSSARPQRGDAHTSQVSPPVQFRLVTFNLWHGQTNGLKESKWQTPLSADATENAPAPRFAPVGTRTPFAAALADLAALSPDIVLFQEADYKQLRSERCDQPAVLAAALGMSHFAFQPMFTGQTWGLRLPAPIMRTPRDPAYLPLRMQLGAFGVGIASRWPLVHVRGIRLGAAWPRLWQGKKFQPYPGFNRAAISANVRLPGGSELSVATTHLELVPAVAKHQLAFAWRFAARHNQPTVLAGDFNLSKEQASDVLGDLPSWVSHASQPEVHALPSYPVGAPTRALDTVVSTGIKVKRLATVALPISDHCAVVADCELTRDEVLTADEHSN